MLRDSGLIVITRCRIMAHRRHHSKISILSFDALFFVTILNRCEQYNWCTSNTNGLPHIISVGSFSPTEIDCSMSMTSVCICGVYPCTGIRVRWTHFGSLFTATLIFSSVVWRLLVTCLPRLDSLILYPFLDLSIGINKVHYSLRQSF